MSKKLKSAKVKKKSDGTKEQKKIVLTEDTLREFSKQFRKENPDVVPADVPDEEVAGRMADSMLQYLDYARENGKEDENSQALRELMEGIKALTK
jgi:hypothetical protein